MNTSKQISQIDIDNLKLIRESVDTLFKAIADRVNQRETNSYKILEIAPQVNNSVSQYFNTSNIDTLDIDASTNSTYTADLCNNNSEMIPDNFYDIVVCTEVLEHTLQPFHAVDEIFRILKPGGTCYISTPFNFRIHGPLPDCWRFTEHGLRQLFVNFNDVEIHATESDRFLAPIHYTLTAKK